jgi:hypothetical protein
MENANILGYVICFQLDDSVADMLYLRNDTFNRSSYFWTSNIMESNLFESEQGANERLKSLLGFSIGSDGTRTPKPGLFEAFRMDMEVVGGKAKEGILWIMPLVLGKGFDHTNVKGRVEKPIKYVYEDDSEL